MRVSGIFFALFRFLIPPAVIITVGLYLYAPLVDCTFPLAKPPEAGCFIPGQERPSVPAEKAPFRLLAFGDPQLEGDTSLTDPNKPTFPSLVELGNKIKDGELSRLPSDLSAAIRGLFDKDVPKLLQGYRKRIDLWGNDLYLAHIYRSVLWWSAPTHTVVLGDLLGSQWIGDDEFKRRSDRFWKKVFKGGEKVPNTITGVSGRTEVLGEDKSWKRRLIAVAGNHDIGYAGDIDEHRVERFEETFGSVNWDIRFRLDNDTTQQPKSFGFGESSFGPTSPELRLLILNSMNLDSPASKPELQQQSRDFAESELHHSNYGISKKSATVLLTHIPLHKPEGVCTDGPFFDYFPSHQGGGIKEQNHLSEQSSHYILDGLGSSEKQGKSIILNGHDHVGCFTYHYRYLSPAGSEGEGEGQWEVKHSGAAQAEILNSSLTGVREITVRSMMGEFYGNAGLLSGWYDREAEEWRFEYNSCMAGVQHIWWGVHVFDLVWLGLGLMGILTLIWEEMGSGQQSADSTRKTKVKNA